MEKTTIGTSQPARSSGSTPLCTCSTVCLPACLSVCTLRYFRWAAEDELSAAQRRPASFFFSLRTGGASFRTNSGLTTDSRNPPPADRKRSPHFLFTFSLLSSLLSLYYLFLRIRAVRSPTWLNSWMAQPLKASMINNVSTVENVEHVGKSSILRLKDEFTPQKYEHVVKFWCEQNTFCSILLNSRSKCGWGLVLKCYRWGSTKWLHSARLLRSKYLEALRSQTDMKRCNTHSFFGGGGGIFFIMLTFFVLHFTFLFQFLIQDSFTLYSAFTLTLRNVHLYTK